MIEPYGGDLPEGRPPFCPPDERVLASGQHRFAHNLAGDPVVAEGWLYPRNGPRITQPGSRQLHADVTRNTPGLDASHLLADYFGGPDIFQNLIPFPEELNLSQWKKFENNLTELAARNPVYLQAYVVRVPGDFIPERVIYHVYQLQGGQLELIQREFIDLTGFLH
ncbi:MAG: DNA/RNA non-specific endonuclease [bacterium]